MAKARQIESAIQLLVEGKDPYNFFKAFIRRLSLANIQIQNFGGVSELSGFLCAFVKSPDFQTVQSIGIVRDAEKSARGAFQSVQSALRNAALPVPDRPAERTNSTDTSPAVTVLILPGGNREGMLETLLCETFAGNPVDHCIDNFFECVESLPDMSIKNEKKARAHAYLTTKPNPHVSVGVAAKKGYWDWDHSAFSTIRGFLKTIAETAP